MDAVGSRSGGYKRPSSVWLLVLDAAQSEQEVLIATKDFLSTWTPLEVSRLPENCRPGRINDAEAIGDLAFHLAQQSLAFSGSLTDRLLLERLTAFFQHATSRIAQLRGGHGPYARHR
jgi:hypothetical protein